jgi:antitoxin MazE
MRARIQKWGNSLALRIPKAFAKETGLANGSPVKFTLEKDKLIIEPEKKEKITLQKLLSQINEKNIHEEVVTDFY